MSVTVRPLSFESKRDINRFIEAQFRAMDGEPHWVPAPRLLQREALTPTKAPFLQYGRAQLFLAERDGEPVGRISAQINPRHDAYHHERAGFFGFFDCVDDAEVSAALLETAEGWLRAQGATFARGPVSFTMNDEVGCLVEGFETRNTVMNPHGRPYYGGLIEASGYAKEKDLLGWGYDVAELIPRIRRWHDRITAMPNVRVRPFDPKHLHRDVRTALEIFNDAWRDNWGFVPVSDAEADHFADQLKFGPLVLADPRITAIVEIDGEPAAMIVAVPDFNEALADLHGSLFPWGWAKFYWRLRRGLRAGRVVLLGLKHEYMRRRELAGLAIMLIGEVHVRGQAAGYEWAELGWVLEDNGLLNSSLQGTTARVSKRYRIYRKELAGG